MEFNVQRDIANRIVEVDGIGINDMPEEFQSYISGVQDCILACRQIENQYNQSQTTILNQIVAETSKNAIAECINTIEYNLCVGIKENAPVEDKDGQLQ